MTGPVATVLIGGLERHAADVTVLAGAAVATAVRPRLAPYLVVLGIVFQSTATHALTSDGLVLAGAAAGLASFRAWRGDWPTLADVPAALGVLLALDALMAASLLANLGTPAAGIAAQATVYFVSRTVLLGGVVILAPRPAIELRDWLSAGATGSLTLGVARLLQIAGLPVQALTSSLSIAVIGDLRDVGSWNEFAVLTVAGGMMALTLAIAWPRPQRPAALWTVAALVMLLAAATGQSRTETLAVLVLLPLLALASTSTANRGILGSAALLFLVVAITPAGSILDKPLVVQASQPAQTIRPPSQTPEASPSTPSSTAPPSDRTVGTTAPQFAAHRSPDIDWRSVLDRPYYRIDQTFSRPNLYVHGNYVAVIVRSAAGSSAVRLRVTVNGQPVGDVGSDRMRPSWDWVVVPIPDDTLSGGRDVTVSLTATGPLDSRTRYISVGGTNGVASDVSSRMYAHGALVVNDLSSDPGLQRGLVIAFLDGRNPSIARIPSAQRAVIDPSLADRTALWWTAWRIFVAHPVLGTGFYTFGSVHDRYASSALFYPYENAHSNFFELLADLGPLGPMLLLLLMATVAVPLLVRAARAGWSPRWPDLALTAIVGAMLLASVTQTWVGDSRVAMFCWLFLLVGSMSAPPFRTLARPEPDAGRAAATAAPE